jgi:PhoH-like ATPase
MKYIADTNVLLNKPELFEKYHMVVTSHVLREIEDLERKYRSDRQLQWEIRRVKNYMDENEHGTVDLKDYKFSLSDDLDPNYVDNILLQVAVDNGYGIITNDRLLRLKAPLYNIPVVKPTEGLGDVYQGYQFIEMDEQEMAYFYNNMMTNTYDLMVNEYIIIRDLNRKTVDKYRWDGKCHMPLKMPRWDKKAQQVYPENDLQECALDLLHNPDIHVKFVLGTYGSGKTFLATKVGLHKLKEKGEHSQIMMIRNPVGTGEEVGFLPGDLDEKTQGFFEPIIQHLEGGEDEAGEMIQKGELAKRIPYYMKGLTIDETYMLIDEAEDLNEKQIKLVGTRIGTNTVAAFVGDINQAEGKYSYDNGLFKAIESLKGNPRVGVIVLDIDVRSEASKLFADM